jgi:tRNA modification GTPase
MKSVSNEDTIVAIATPSGRGGIGVVRLSGDGAVQIVCDLIRFANQSVEIQRATVGELMDAHCEGMLDQVVVTCFRKPHSYTGEDVAEVSCHGSPVILQELVERCVERGARPAEPGEFTMRAFLNGRIDLTQAEAVRDLIESRTLYQARVAAQQMQGGISRSLQPHKRELVELIARLEAGIDFAEDDVPVSSWDEISSSLKVIRSDLTTLVEGYAYGRIIREGLSLAIVGRPNVGKSSLFNRLLSQERSIVTAVPGTTRDLVSETAEVEGIPLRFVDTAGIRETADEVETIGVQRSLQATAESDLRLLVLDASERWTDQDSRLLEKVCPLGRLLVACNKCDLPVALDREMLENLLRRSGNGIESSGSTITQPDYMQQQVQLVWISALTGAGFDELRSKILEMAAPRHGAGPEGEYLTNLRHVQLVKASLQALERALEASALKVHHEMLLLELYDALHALDEITGATTVEDLLGVIFSTFCVGK